MRRFRTLAAFALVALFSAVAAGPAAAASGPAVPTIQGGFPPAIGAVLTATPNAAAPTDSVAWEVCGTYRVGDAYTGTPSSTYTLSSADVGAPVCAVELGPSNVIDGISDGLAPPGVSASGAPVTEGETITLTPGVWGSGASTPADTWLSCPSGGACSTITPTPTGRAYTASRADVGASISVVESATATGSGASASTSTATGIVAATPPVDSTPPSISGAAQVGATLTASPGGWSNDPTGYTFQWQRCASGTCTAISGATGPTYVPVPADMGDQLVVLVAGVIDPGAPYGSTGEPVLSYPVNIPSAPSPTPGPVPVVPAPVVPVAPPSVVQVTQPSAPTGAISRLTATMQWTFRYAPRETQVVTLAVEGPALGSVIATRCRGSGCPFRVQRIRVRGLKRCRMSGGTHCRAPRVIDLAWEFHGRRLGVGTVITVAISRRGDIGRYYRFAVRRRRGPAVRINCLAPGSARPGRGCTAA